MWKEYAYARISRKTQKIERQIENLTKAFPDTRLYQEAYTGTKTEGRREFNRMLSVVNSGDTIVFDSISRMSTLFIFSTLSCSMIRLSLTSPAYTAVICVTFGCSLVSFSRHFMIFSTFCSVCLKDFHFVYS